jgi:hypothetical protein
VASFRVRRLTVCDPVLRIACVVQASFMALVRIRIGSRSTAMDGPMTEAFGTAAGGAGRSTTRTCSRWSWSSRPDPVNPWRYPGPIWTAPATVAGGNVDRPARPCCHTGVEVEPPRSQFQLVQCYFGPTPRKPAGSSSTRMTPRRRPCKGPDHRWTAHGAAWLGAERRRRLRGCSVLINFTPPPHAIHTLLKQSAAMKILMHPIEICPVSDGRLLRPVATPVALGTTARVDR